MVQQRRCQESADLHRVWESTENSCHQSRANVQGCWERTELRLRFQSGKRGACSNVRPRTFCHCPPPDLYMGPSDYARWYWITTETISILVQFIAASINSRHPTWSGMLLIQTEILQYYIRKKENYSASTYYILSVWSNNSPSPTTPPSNQLVFHLFMSGIIFWDLLWINLTIISSIRWS